MSDETQDSLFTVKAKDPAMEAVLQKIVDHVAESDEFRDMIGMARKGREPDYLYGRWCVRCHNSLPEDWGIKPCDVCGAATGSTVSLDGLLAGSECGIVNPYYGGIERAKENAETEEVAPTGER